MRTGDPERTGTETNEEDSTEVEMTGANGHDTNNGVGKGRRKLIRPVAARTWPSLRSERGS